ncbi:hypothetical protein AGOR_G00216150 [Albula goreensis]|uniref:Methyltransferase type 11 domain-containing protein n=1 Tax=Albula goreensis TaxID=1534307 RepID=A0A8T3CKR8_9TELE|nr:hypothetical protein AGOR_G00216150 [Albula goreensis]
MDTGIWIMAHLVPSFLGEGIFLFMRQPTNHPDSIKGIKQMHYNRDTLVSFSPSVLHYFSLRNWCKTHIYSDLYHRKSSIKMAPDLLRVIPRFPAMLANSMTCNLAKPTNTMMGRFAQRTMEKYNNTLMRNAVKLCQIQPNHNILEVGFGPGVGLLQATTYLKGPKGRLFGLDFSEYMHKVAKTRLASHPDIGNVHLLYGRVERIPLPDQCINGVYHSNCHMYWPDPTAAAAELLRVMKPGAKMVATVDLAFLRHGASQGFFQGVCVEPDPYMEALTKMGFKDVHMEDKEDEGKTFQAIFATAPPA